MAKIVGIGNYHQQSLGQPETCPACPKVVPAVLWGGFGMALGFAAAVIFYGAVRDREPI